jgi:hypothetical protein
MALTSHTSGIMPQMPGVYTREINFSEVIDPKTRTWRALLDGYNSMYSSISRMDITTLQIVRKHFQEVFPGPYTIVWHADSMSFKMIFESPEEQTMWILRNK